jgi:hypothetical protein
MNVIFLAVSGADELSQISQCVIAKDAWSILEIMQSSKLQMLREK